MNLKKVLVAGMVAGMLMGAIQMMYEAIWGHGFWSPVVFIAATVMRGLQSTAGPAPVAAMPVLVGLMGHMMNSIILALLFATLARNIENRSTFVFAGMGFGLAVFVMMWFGVIPLLDPVMRQLNAPMFAVSHLMWGGALATLLVARTRSGALQVVPEVAVANCS